MGYSKNEVNLMRLIASAPHQQNPANRSQLLRELLENMTAEITAEELPRISKAKVNDYSEKIEAIAAKLDVPTKQSLQCRQLSLSEAGDAIQPLALVETSQTEEASSPTGLRRRFRLHRKPEEEEEDAAERDSTTTIKLDAASQAH